MAHDIGSLEDVARRLNLGSVSRGVLGDRHVQGNLYGQGVSWSQTIDRNPATWAWRYTSKTVARWPFPVDMNLAVSSSHSASANLAHLLTGDEETRVSHLLTPEVTKIIQTTLDLNLSLAVSDEGVAVTRVQDWMTSFDIPADVCGFEHDVLVTATLCQFLSQEFPNVPAAAVLRESETLWREIAARKNYEFSATPLTLRGRRDALFIDTRASRLKDGQYALAIVVWAEMPLTVDLSFRRREKRNWLERLLGQFDHPTDDPVFDEVFTVSAKHKEQITHLLDAPTRAALLALASDGRRVWLDNRGLWVRLPALDHPESTEALIEQTLAVAESIRQRGLTLA